MTKSASTHQGVPLKMSQYPATVHEPYCLCFSWARILARKSRRSRARELLCGRLFARCTSKEASKRANNHGQFSPHLARPMNRANNPAHIPYACLRRSRCSCMQVYKLAGRACYCVIMAHDGSLCIIDIRYRDRPKLLALSPAAFGEWLEKCQPGCGKRATTRNSK